MFYYISYIWTSLFAETCRRFLFYLLVKSRQAIQTHTCRCSDGVGTGDERLAVVEAYKNIHRPAKQKQETGYLSRSRSNNLNGLNWRQRWIFCAPHRQIIVFNHFNFFFKNTNNLRWSLANQKHAKHPVHLLDNILWKSVCISLG